MARGNLVEAMTGIRGSAFLYASAVGTGAANAPLLDGLGFTGPAVRTGVGTYQFRLTDPYVRITKFQMSFKDPTAPAVWDSVLLTENVSAALPSARLVTVQLFKAGVATDLTSDETMYLELILCRSIAKPRK
jgi:hypothetical protein